MPEENKINFARLYVQLFLVVHVLVLPVGLFFMVGLMNSGPSVNHVYGGLGLILLGAYVGTVQPLIAIVTGICYLKMIRWAKIGMIVILTVILGFWTLFATDMYLHSLGQKGLALLIWLVAAALIAPGIILVYRQRYVHRKNVATDNNGSCLS